MKPDLYKFPAVFVMIFALQFGVVFSQQARLNALSVTPSNAVQDLISYKAANPNAGVEDLVAAGNKLLDKQGYNYAFIFYEATCQALAEGRRKQANSKKPVNLTARLDSVAGDVTSLVLPDEKRDPSECGRCFVDLPVWEVTEKNFVMFVRGINVKFHLPAGFQLNEVALVDNQNLATVIKRWKIPSRLAAAPLSVSDDGKILYLELPQKELSDLVMMIFDEGVVQFYDRKKVDSDKKGKLLTAAAATEAATGAGANISYIVFENGETKQTLRFSPQCGGGGSGGGGGQTLR